MTTSNKKEMYLIKPRFNESPQHCFLTYDIANYLKKFQEIKNVKTPETKKPDITFRIKNKEYGIEVETGNILKTNRQSLLEKIEKNNEEYRKRWFFVVTAKKLAAKYNRLAKTHDKRTVKQAVSRIVKKA